MIPTVLPYMKKKIDAKFDGDGTLMHVSTIRYFVPGVVNATRELAPRDKAFRVRRAVLSIVCGPRLARRCGFDLDIGLG